MNNARVLQNSLMLTLLIGASDTLVSALSLALLSLLVISVYGMKMSLLRPRIQPPLQLITGTLLAAALTSLAALALQGWAFELHQQLGIYVGLLALQCVVLEYSGFFTRTLMPDRLRLCALFGAAMVILGTVREGLGHGSFASHLQWLVGITDSNGSGWVLIEGGGLRLAVITPGGFILLGLLLAAKRAWPGTSTSH
ncbi:Rnf-Nqr domain containing protein [Pseudomonas sp. Irchel s3h17]|uniref:Rnf-Nqr domain containing protein n=1 Tax=Pseudomonas sp. Irchel s3h17 TaxID=2009182 RepID=UPI000BA45748|nr:Rnf-Nqr domain containing protein [Pseudomonas sp. Irchel s3h17]